MIKLKSFHFLILLNFGFFRNNLVKRAIPADRQDAHFIGRRGDKEVEDKEVCDSIRWRMDGLQNFDPFAPIGFKERVLRRKFGDKQV